MDDPALVMNRSLRGRLSMGLGIAIAGMGVIAGIASFFLALNEAQEYQDASLQQIATLIPSPFWRNAGHHYSIPEDTDPDARIIVESLGPENSHAQETLLKLPAQLPAGFHTLLVNGQKWRIFVRRQGPAAALAVAQSTDVRSDAAFASAWRTLLPLVFLVPLLMAFSGWVVRRTLAPIHSLALAVDQQDANHPSPLCAEQVPEEITPFLHAINRMLERIRLLLDQQRFFIADAAHELRTPLTALSLQVQNLERADTLSEYKKRLEPLQSGLARSRHLLDQLLGLAREQGAASPLTPVDMAAIARQVVEEVYPLAAQKGIDLGLEAATALWVMGTDSALYSLLRNVVDNALRYSPEDSEVTVRVFSKGDDALLEVIDSGPGIPEAEKDRLFEPFYRIPGTEEEGSGLGLTIVRSIAAHLGGEIVLRARADQPGLHFIYRQTKFHLIQS